LFTFAFTTSNIDCLNTTIITRLKTCVLSAIPKALKTAWWLIKITVPVTFIVFLLNFTGILHIVSGWLNPFFSLLGLPGESAFVLITSVFANVYSVVAVISTLGMPVREAVILAVMCLISHGFLIETAVLRKTGSSVIRMLLLRLSASLVAGVLLNLILPELPGYVNASVAIEETSFVNSFINWGTSMFFLCLKIMILISSLLILQRILEEFGIIRLLSFLLKPLLKVFGLPESTSLSWLVANIVGLAYGSAIMMEQVEEGRLSRADADLVNHHVAVSHSQLEDPLLFLAIGLPMHWLMWPRLLLAIAAVWLRRAELSIRNRHSKS